MIDESPRDAAGYAQLSDQRVHEDLPARAVEVLEEAFAAPVDNEADNEADRGLRGRLSSLSSGSGASEGDQGGIK